MCKAASRRYEGLISSFAKKDVKSEDKVSVEDKDSLVRAMVFALGGISDEEISGIMRTLHEGRWKDRVFCVMGYFLRKVLVA